MHIEHDELIVLKNNQKLLVKALHPYQWALILDELEDPVSLRKQLRGPYSGQYIIKYDRKIEKYYVKQISTYEHKEKYEFTTYWSTSLMKRSGEYSSSWGSIGTGLLMDLDSCKVKEDYVYAHDGCTGIFGKRTGQSDQNNKIYLNQQDAEKKAKELNAKPNEEPGWNYEVQKKYRVSLNELRAQVKSDKISNNGLDGHNELLVGVQPKSIKGLFVEIEPDAEEIDRLTAVIFVLMQQKKFFEKFNQKLPIYIVNSLNELRCYSETDLEIDKKIWQLCSNKESFLERYNEMRLRDVKFLQENKKRSIDIDKVLPIPILEEIDQFLGPTIKERLITAINAEIDRLENGSHSFFAINKMKKASMIETALEKIASLDEENLNINSLLDYKEPQGQSLREALNYNRLLVQRKETNTLTRIEEIAEVLEDELARQQSELR